MSRKRKKIPLGDRAYRQGQGSKRKTPDNASGSQTENLINLMDAGAPHVEFGAILNSSPSVDLNATPSTPLKSNSKTKFVTPTRLTLSTPAKGPLTSEAETPGGSKYQNVFTIECEDGALGILLPKDKVGSQRLEIPAKPLPWIASSPIPKAKMDGIKDFEITAQKIKAIQAQTRKRKQNGENPRKYSQNQIMGIPALKALRNAGIKAPPRSAQYPHLISHAFSGDKGMSVENFCIGTRFGNAANELVNIPIRRLLTRKKNPLLKIYLSVIPEWVPGFEGIRLAKNLTYIIKDGPENNYQRSATIKFNMLSMERINLSQIAPIRNFIMQKFSPLPPQPIPSPPQIVTASKKMKQKQITNSSDIDKENNPLFEPSKNILPAFSRQQTLQGYSPEKPCSAQLLKSSARPRKLFN